MATVKIPNVLKVRLDRAARAMDQPQMIKPGDGFLRELGIVREPRPSLEDVIRDRLVEAGISGVSSQLADLRKVRLHEREEPSDG